MMLTYDNIKDMMGDEVLASGYDDEGNKLVFTWCPSADEDAYMVSFISKVTDCGTWWCNHIYDENGGIAEMFEFSEE